MRLTLRTLLAYTDDILDPADHEDLGKKIEASDFATELIHRSRDVVRRLRLGAPDVLAGGESDDVLESVSVADANAVSEYLDNTLSPEDVADFERMCLEPGNDADMHLAEVASCHHVLTMVLGEPAEIDLDVRRRIYALPEQMARGQKLRIEPPHNATAEDVTAEVPPQQVVAEVAHLPGPVATEVPDYLRAAADSRQRSKRWAVAALLMVVAGTTAYFVSGAFVESEPPVELAQGDLDSATGDLAIGDVGEALGSAAVVVGAESPDSEAPVFVPEADRSTANSEVALEEEAVPLVASSDDVVESVEVPMEIPSETTELEPLDLDVEFPEVVPGSESPGALVETLSEEFPAESTEASLAEVEMAEPSGVEAEPLLVASRGDAPSGEVAVEEEVPAGPMGPVQLGTYLGNNDVLLRYDSASGKWIRMPPRSEVLTGSSLLALPKFRVHVVLGDVNMYLSGGTRIELPIAKASAGSLERELEVSIDYGRVLLNASLNGSRVALHVGDEIRHIHLAGSSSLAVEVQRVFVPGSNNEQVSSPVKATWYLTSGTAEILGDLDTPLSIPAPAQWTTTGGVDDPARPIEKLPEWIDREPMTDLQRSAREALIKELVAGQPVGIRLLELNDQRDKGRRSEVRALAAEASVYVGEFEPFVKALSDKAQRRVWKTHIQTLRQAMALSPDVALNVRKAFVDLRGEQAATNLIEMVAGYDKEAIGMTREAIQEGALASLISWLEDDSLDTRVLAIYNLNEILGTTSLKGFQADDSSKRRRIAVAKIQKSFEANELLPKP